VRLSPLPPSLSSAPRRGSSVNPLRLVLHFRTVAHCRLQRGRSFSHHPHTAAMSAIPSQPASPSARPSRVAVALLIIAVTVTLLAGLLPHAYRVPFAFAVVWWLYWIVPTVFVVAACVSMLSTAGRAKRARWAHPSYTTSWDANATPGSPMMHTLTEISNVRQISDEPRRRWFRSDDLDLIVWCDESGAPTSFQLCYNKPRSEHALTWTPELGFLHTAVDDGEDVGVRYKEAPILVADGHSDANRLGDRFAAASAQLPREIVEFVGNKLKQHPNYVHRA